MVRGTVLQHGAWFQENYGEGGGGGLFYSTWSQGDYLQCHGKTKYSAMDGPGDHLYYDSTYLLLHKWIQSQTACCLSSTSQRWSSSLLSQDEFLHPFYLANWEKPETREVGLQQLTAGWILFSVTPMKTRIEALVPVQTSPLQSQG